MKVYSNFSLLHHNTMGIAATAAVYVEYSTEAELSEALRRRARDEKLLFIGQGSNLLFTHDFEGTVMHGNIGGIEVVEDGDDSSIVRVGAGVVWDDFVCWCLEHRLYGVENLSLIPGEVGAAAVQNIGAYGAELSDVAEAVETIEVATGEARTFSRQECAYAYRHSFFKDHFEEYVVHHVRFRLSKHFVPLLKYGSLKKEFASREGSVDAGQIRQYVVAARQSKLPDPAEIGNAGSFFMNPVVEPAKMQSLRASYPDIPHFASEGGGEKIPAAWLIEQCGWKGRRVGNVGVYARQPLVIVNYGGATAKEVVEQAERVVADVRARFGINLKPEVQYI